MMAGKKLGNRLLVIGAGIGGSFAAGVLSQYFDEVLLVERDASLEVEGVRKGVPQGSHIHAVLRRPIDIASELFPDFEEHLRAAGGVPLRAGTHLRFHDAGSWQPQRDLGFTIYSQTRPLLEQVIRDHVLRLDGVTLKQGLTLLDYQIQDGRVTGATFKTQTGQVEAISADFCVDASGRSGGIVQLLKRHGYDDLEVTELGVNICYGSALFSRNTATGELPAACVVRGNPPATRSGTLFPVEGDRWVVSLSGRFGDFPESDDDAFMAFAKSLGDPIIYDTIKDAKRLTPYTRFLIPRIYWRRYERMQRFPEGLVPIGDTLSAFNPVYGQGMAVAAMHAFQLGEVLKTRVNAGGTLRDAGAECLQAVANVTKIAWDMSEPVDLAYPETTGTRPAGFEARVRQAKTVRQALDASPDVHRAYFRVANFLDPASALDEALVREGVSPATTEAYP